MCSKLIIKIIISGEVATGHHVADLVLSYKITTLARNIITISFTQTPTKKTKMDLLQMIMGSEPTECKNLSINIESPRLTVRTGTRRVRDTVPAIITFENTSRRLKNAHLKWKSMPLYACM